MFTLTRLAASVLIVSAVVVLLYPVVTFSADSLSTLVDTLSTLSK